MQPTAESRKITRNFARVIGPYIAIVTAIIIFKAHDMGAYLAGTFANPVIPWMLGAMLLFFALVIIAFHQYWNGPAAVMISLLGWFLGIRGLILLAAPQLIERGGEAAVAPDKVLWMRIGFFSLTLIGLYLTYSGWIKKSE